MTGMSGTGSVTVQFGLPIPLLALNWDANVPIAETEESSRYQNILEG